MMRVAVRKRMIFGIGAVAGVALLCVTAIISGAVFGKKEAPITIYEAEEGQLTGTTISQSAEGFSGASFVTDFTDESDMLTFTVNAKKSSLYSVTISYRSTSGDKVADLALNGNPAGQLSLAASNLFAEVSAGKMWLNEGENTISLKRGWGYYDIDYLKLQKTKASPRKEVSDKLVNPNATSEAKALMKYLAKSYGKEMISGQQGLDNVDWLFKVTGKKPAIVGFDLIEYTPSRVEHGSQSYEIESAMNWYKQGGIVSFLWHWNAPKGLIDEPGKEWWRGFYTDSVTFDLEYALAHLESEDYKLLLRDMDVIAEHLTRLQDKGIPVLFRPLHEAEGGWFWWGAKGPEPAKQLYRTLYDRLVNMHKLNNLIWIWNSESPDWYPGDDVVDIISVDSYPEAGDHSPISNRYDNLAALVENKKIVALTENGSIPDPDLMAQYGANWGWFSTWTGEYLMDGKHNDEAFLNHVFNHNNVVTLDELPNLFGGDKGAE